MHVHCKYFQTGDLNKKCRYLKTKFIWYKNVFGINFTFCFVHYSLNTWWIVSFIWAVFTVWLRPEASCRATCAVTAPPPDPHGTNTHNTHNYQTVYSSLSLNLHSSRVSRWTSPVWAKNNLYEFVVLVLLVNIAITIYSLRAPEHHGAVDKMLYFYANWYFFIYLPFMFIYFDVSRLSLCSLASRLLVTST